MKCTLKKGISLKLVMSGDVPEFRTGERVPRPPGGGTHGYGPSHRTPRGHLHFSKFTFWVLN